MIKKEQEQEYLIQGETIDEYIVLSCTQIDNRVKDFKNDIQFLCDTVFRAELKQDIRLMLLESEIKRIQDYTQEIFNVLISFKEAIIEGKKIHLNINFLKAFKKP